VCTPFQVEFLGEIIDRLLETHTREKSVERYKRCPGSGDSGCVPELELRHNSGHGHRTLVLDLTETIQQATDTDSEIVHTDPRPADIDHSAADISKARERLGYEPQVSLHDGIKSMAQG